MARGTRAAGRVLAFILVARLFAVETTGQFSFLVSLGTLLGLLADLGLPEYLVREVPARPDDAGALERTALRLRLIGFGLSCALGYGAVLLFDPAAGAAAGGVLMYAGAAACGDYLGALRRSRQRNDLEALEVGLPTLAGLAAAAAVGLTGGGFAAFCWTMGTSATLLVLWRYRLRLGQLQREPHRTAVSLGSLAQGGRWFMLRALLSWAHFDLTLMLLKALAGRRKVAIYAAAMRPVGLLTLPFLVLNQVFLPRLSAALGSGDAVGFRRGVQRLNLVGLLLAPAGFAASLAGGELLLRMFGSSYLAARPVLVLLTLAVLVQFALPSAVPLVTVGRERALFWVSLAGVLVLAVSGALLVPGRGATGAAEAALMTYAVIKAGHFAIYAAQPMRPGGWPHLLTAAATTPWLLAQARLSGPTRWAVLGLGGLIGGALALRQMLTPDRDEERP